MLSSIPPLQDEEEDVSYDVEPLFTNILIQETINYNIEQRTRTTSGVSIYWSLTMEENIIAVITQETDFQKIADKTCYGMHF